MDSAAFYCGTVYSRYNTTVQYMVGAGVLCSDWNAASAHPKITTEEGQPYSTWDFKLPRNPLKGLGHQMDWTFADMCGYRSKPRAGFEIFQGAPQIFL